MLLSTSLSMFAAADKETDDSEITLDYLFETPTIATVDIGEKVYDQIKIKDAPCGGNPGEPRLPVKDAYIFIPQGKTVSDITVTFDRMSYLGAGFMIEPVGEPVALSTNSEAPLPIPDETIYNYTNQFPGKLFTNVGTYWKKGYQILVLKLHPVQYIPITGELYYYHNLMVSVDATDDNSVDATATLYRGLEKDKDTIITAIDNPITLTSFSPPSFKSEPPAQDNYALLIITTESLKSGFEPLQEAHEERGIRTIIRTLSDIGSNNPEAIREYIKDIYMTEGIEYVLIGGDHDVVPAKMLWVCCVDSGNTYETFMPSDLYYGCLDGTFNFDGDDRWGEPTDGENGGDVDLMAEVYVGRASVGKAKEVYRFVSKTIAYMSTEGDDEYLKEALLVGEWLGFGGEAEWGGNHLDELIDGCSKYNYTTVGIPPNEYHTYKLYDRDWGKNGWPKIVLISRINNCNPHFILNDGHGAHNKIMKLRNLYVYSLINDKYFFMYATGCDGGYFDATFDCFAEYVTIKTDHAAFATIMNARYGWGAWDITDSASQRFHREFWDAVFGEDKSEIGKANQDSKEDNLWRIGEECMRYTYYELNLFGDPSVDLLNHSIGGNNGGDGDGDGDGDDSNEKQVKYGWDINGDFLIDQQTSFYPSSTPLTVLPSGLLPAPHLMSINANGIVGEECQWLDPIGSTSLLNRQNSSSQESLISGSQSSSSQKSPISSSDQNSANKLQSESGQSEQSSGSFVRG